MSRNNIEQIRNRKRSTDQAGLNNSLAVQPKQLRYTKRQVNMATGNGTFQDLSGTIIAKPTRTVHTPTTIENMETGPSTSVSAGVIGPEVRELVVDETLVVQRALEENVKKMVQEEMSEIRRSMSELTRVVQEMDRRSRTQESENSMANDGGTRTVPQANRFTFPSFTDPIVTNGINTDGNANRMTERVNIRVDKWGIVFDGNNTHMSVEDFIFRIEHLQSHYNISWNEILRDFHLLVTGTAKDWYWLLIRTHGSMNWPTMKCELLNQYRTNTSNFEIMRDLVERRQQPNESLEFFFHVMCKLRSRLVQPIPEFDMIKILKRNVKESVARIVYPIAVSSVEQLRIECIEAERNFPKRDMRNNIPQQRLGRSVNEMRFENEEDQETPGEEVSEIRMAQQKLQLRCWNCNLTGHGFRDCNSTERSLFCYRCGKPNVIAPKCPDCQQGNLRRDVGMSGGQRPSKNPTV